MRRELAVCEIDDARAEGKSGGGESGYQVSLDHGPHALHSTDDRSLCNAWPDNCQRLAHEGRMLKGGIGLASRGLTTSMYISICYLPLSSSPNLAWPSLRARAHPVAERSCLPPCGGSAGWQQQWQSSKRRRNRLEQGALAWVSWFTEKVRRIHQACLSAPHSRQLRVPMGRYTSILD